jgi:hypothetical protein
MSFPLEYARVYVGTAYIWSMVDFWHEARFMPEQALRFDGRCHSLLSQTVTAWLSNPVLRLCNLATPAALGRFAPWLGGPVAVWRVI